MTHATRPTAGEISTMHEGTGGEEVRCASVHAIVTARFALLEMAYEALDEGQLWFSEDDLECVRAPDEYNAEPPLAAGGYVRMRVSGPEDTARAIRILLGRGATHVDVLAPVPGAADG